MESFGQLLTGKWCWPAATAFGSYINVDRLKSDLDVYGVPFEIVDPLTATWQPLITSKRYDVYCFGNVQRHQEVTVRRVTWT